MRVTDLRLPIILTLLLTILPIFAQKSQQTVNPIYIANLLVDDISTERMAQTCSFHHMTEAAPEDGYTVFNDNKGNKIRFKRTDNQNEGINGKLIEVITKDNIKAIEKILKETGYKKIDQAYERGSRQTNSLLRCTLSPGTPKTLRFHKITK